MIEFFCIVKVSGCFDEQGTAKQMFKHIHSYSHKKVIPGGRDTELIHTSLHIFHLTAMTTRNISWKLFI